MLRHGFGISNLSLVVALAATAYPLAATAQAVPGPAQPTQPDDAMTDDAPDAPSVAADIVVTGTRLANGTNAPTPVTVISANQLAQANPVLVSEALNQLPVFKGSSRSTTSTQSQVRDSGSSFLNLRGLGKEKTLVLLDGRRFVSSNTSGVPDVNLFPQNLIQRVDVVTGGASAAYGSDAVSGVVNFILDSKFSGIKLDANAGVTTRGDGGSQSVSLAGGMPFADGRGHILVSGQYFSQDGIPFGTGRKNVDVFWGISAIGGGVLSVVPDQRFAIPTGGRIHSLPAGSPLSPSILNQQFLDGGVIAPYSFGTRFDGVRQVGGDGANLPSDVSADLKRYVGFTRGEFDATDRLKVYGEFSAAQATADTGFQHPQVGILGYQFTIFSDNAFLRQLPAATQATLGLPPAGGPSTALFSLRRIPYDNGLVRSNVRNRTWRAVAGFDYDLGSDFQLNGYYMHGDSQYRSRVYNNPIQSRRYAAVDAVVDPATGRVVCRSALSGALPDCVPMNPFGPNPGNQAAYAWINGTSQVDTDLKEDVASLIVRGSPFKLPAGPVNMAAGLEYRKESAVQTVDPITARTLTAGDVASIRAFPTQLLNLPGGDFHYPAGQPLRGSYNVKEGFIEADAPLLEDIAAVNLLSVNGAVRLIDYSTAGTVTTWKIGGIYEPVEGVRFRATRSRDIRAANIQELFTKNIPQTGTVIFNGVARPVNGFRSGNPDLDPEVADTLTYGVVFRPAFLPGFDFSIDRYDIKINGAITQLTNQQTVNACAAGSAVACSRITDTPTSLTIITPTLNLAKVTSKGIDFEAGYRRSMLGGDLRVRGFLTYLEEFANIVPGAPVIDRAGDIGLTGTPKWSGTLQASFDRKGTGIFLQERWIGPGKVDSTLTDAQLVGNDVTDVWYTDVTVRQAFGDDLRSEVFLTVNNLFDRSPPVAPASPFGNFRSSNPGLYDFIGRYVTVGVRARF